MISKLKGYLEKSNDEIVGIASTEREDRQGEKIKQDGWDLKNFKKNPVLMASHRYDQFPIGKVTNIKVEDNRLTFKAIFSEATALALEAKQLVSEGILKAFSVGFIPREYDAKNPSMITKAELLEISLVSIPANPEAIVVAKAFMAEHENNLLKEIVKVWMSDDKLKKAVDDLEKTDVNKVDENVDIEKEDVNKTEIDSDKTATEDQKGEVKKDGKASGEVEDINLKLIQKTTGYLQELCRDLKKKGGVTND